MGTAKEVGETSEYPRKSEPPESRNLSGGPFVLTCPCRAGQATCTHSSQLRLLRPTQRSRRE
jgi:hypothetical protein